MTSAFQLRETHLTSKLILEVKSVPSLTEPKILNLAGSASLRAILSELDHEVSQQGTHSINYSIKCELNDS